MNPGRFFMPRMGANIGPMMRASYLPAGGSVGLFGRITNSLRSFNWSGLLSGANKTLNVVNQTIPLVRQAGPMFNNMKSMLKLARAFGGETTRGNTNNSNNNRISISNVNNISNNINNKENVVQKKEGDNNNYPNFFI